jgi:hypothetical protein
MFEFAENITNRYVNAPLSTSLGKAKIMNSTDQIGFERPVIFSIVDILIVLLFAGGFVGLILLIAPVLVAIGVSNGLVSGLIVTTLSTSILGAASMIHRFFNKMPHKIIIVKHQLYLYVDGSYGTLETSALSQVKASIDDFNLMVQIPDGATFWLDLKTVEDEAWKEEFLKYFGLTLN